MRGVTNYVRKHTRGNDLKHKSRVQISPVRVWNDAQCTKTKFNYRLKKSNDTQQYADIYLLLNCSTCFGRPSRLSSGMHKTVVAASGTAHTIWGASFLKRNQIRAGLGPSVTFEEACSPDSMNCTRGCNYIFMYSRWWARWTPETCTVI